jgi:archaellum component FlaF (FlaF/FlaG flagellin family)
MLVLGTIFIFSKNILLQDRQSMMATGKIVAENVNTHVFIETANYSLSTISVQAKNQGSTTLKIEYLDIYIDQIRIPRDVSNRTISIVAPDITNPGLFDPDETIEINVTFPLPSGNHTVKLVTEHEASSSKIFEVI